MIRSLLSFYSWQYPFALLRLWHDRSQYHFGYVSAYWQTRRFSVEIGPVGRARLPAHERVAVFLLYLGIAGQLLLGVWLLVLGARHELAGGLQFGTALIISYPLVWGHLLPITIMLSWLAEPKALGRAILCAILESQVRRLRLKRHFDLVAVVGSVGKTSTKMAIATVLNASRKVLWQEGNYNDRVTVPLIFFGQTEPSIFNVMAWLRIIMSNERQLRRPYPYETVVVELGIDGPGQMQAFAYLHPELVVVTAIGAEHMEYFGTLDVVAYEELLALNFAHRALVNTEDTAAEYLSDRTYTSYGMHSNADYYSTKPIYVGLSGQKLTIHLKKETTLKVNVPLLGTQGAKICVAAAAAAHMLGLSAKDIDAGLSTARAMAGRMQLLEGINDSILIDDTYNSSPLSAKAALDVLQNGDAPQRIAILGSMNELGDYTEAAHHEVAEHCDPAALDWVVTIGPAANQYLAPLAESRGCKVKTFDSPYAAGAFVKERLASAGAAVLIKGSQNRVFAEESIKCLLRHPEDTQKLVRQSAYWMAIKRRQFGPDNR